MNDEDGALNYAKISGCIPMPSELEARTRLKNFWISWYWPEALGTFELHSPWWQSGSRVAMNMKTKEVIEDTPTIVAAVRAENEDAAMGIIIAAFDKKPASLEWRFCEERPSDWSPFSSRFPRGDWMKW